MASPLEPKIRRRFTPFAVVGLLALLVAAVPPAPSDWTLIWVATGLTAMIALAGVVTPWSRLPTGTYILLPLAYFAVVVLLRHAHGGSASGYAPLAVLPVIWVALNLGRKEVAASLVAGSAVFFLPPLLGADYGAGELRRGLVWLGVAALVGFAVESLVREKRTEARQARTQAEALAEHERVMSTIAEVVRGLTSTGDARRLICQSVLDVAGANVAAIVEPDGTGHLVVTASAGTEFTRKRFRLGVEPSGSAVAFAAGQRFFVPVAAESPALPQDVIAETGMASAHFEPILRDGVPVGVLAVGWSYHVDSVADRAIQAVSLLAAEAAAAIERSDLLARLEALARTDELTGLPNRRSWEDVLRDAVASAASSNSALCVGVIDLDRFKAYNDAKGHQAGDRLLKTAAAEWRTALRGGDVLARYGGEEFAVALPACSLDEARAVLERLRERTPDGQTCSIGLAQWNGLEQPAELVARADEALYEAKRAGRDALVAT